MNDKAPNNNGGDATNDEVFDKTQGQHRVNTHQGARSGDPGGFQDGGIA